MKTDPKETITPPSCRNGIAVEHLHTVDYDHRPGPTTGREEEESLGIRDYTASGVRIRHRTIFPVPSIG